MAVCKSNGPQVQAFTPEQAAEYMQDILAGLEKLARAHRQPLLAHLLDMARREAKWLSKR
jgi:hypothetical protein